MFKLTKTQNRQKIQCLVVDILWAINAALFCIIIFGLLAIMALGVSAVLT